MEIAPIAIEQNKKKALLARDQEVDIENKHIWITSNGKDLDFCVDPYFLSHLDVSLPRNKLFVAESQTVNLPRKPIFMFEKDRISIGFVQSGGLRRITNQPDGYPLYPDR